MLDPSPPRRPRPRRGSQVLDAGTPAESCAPRARPGQRARRSRRAGCSSQTSSRRGSRRCSPPASTTSRRRGSRRCARTCGAARSQRDGEPARPGRPARRAPAGGAVGAAVANLLDVERRGAKAYLPGAAASLGERAQAAVELEAQLEQEEIGKLDDRELGAFLEERGRLRRVGDGFAVSTDLYDRGARAAADARPDHARGVPRRARRRPQDRAAASRALRRRRADAAPRRRSHVAPSASRELGVRLIRSALEWHGPVAQRVFKTRQAWQPHAGSVRLRGRSVERCSASPTRESDSATWSGLIKMTSTA